MAPASGRALPTTIGLGLVLALVAAAAPGARAATVVRCGGCTCRATAPGASVLCAEGGQCYVKGGDDGDGAVGVSSVRVFGEGRGGKVA